MTDQNFHYDEEVSRGQSVLATTKDMAAQRRYVLRLLKLKQSEHVLDVGSGNGFLVREMAEVVGTGSMVAGVDIALPMTETARDHCRDLPNTVLKTAPAEALPFDNCSFDVVTSTQCLNYVSNVVAALDEMNRVLKPGGRVVLLETDWASLVWNCSNQALMDKIMARFMQIHADVHLPRSLSRKLFDAGFTITDRSSFPIVNWTHAPDSYAGQQIRFVESLAEAHGALRWMSCMSGYMTFGR